jgi:hypothetical protein
MDNAGRYVTRSSNAFYFLVGLHVQATADLLIQVHISCDNLDHYQITDLPLSGHHGWLHWFNYPIPGQKSRFVCP